MDNQTPPDEIPSPTEPVAGELPETTYEREDDRYSFRNQLRDWGILAIMIVIYLAWTGVIYLFEPGIR